MTRLLMTTDAVGGVWQYSLELSRSLASHGVETVLAVMGPPESLLPATGSFPVADQRPGEGSARADGENAGLVRVVHTGLPLDWLASDAVAVGKSGDAIAALARDVEADVIHLNSPALAAATSFTIPVVAVAHGCVGTWWRAARGAAPDPTYAWHGTLMRAGLTRADVAVAPSAAFAATLRRTYELAAAPVVVHNGRTPLTLPPSAAAPVDAVLTAGRLWDQVKNTPLLDRVAAMIDVPFRAAGPLQSPHGERTVPGHLHHLGSLDETALAAELATTPIFVSAASFEPFGLAVLEAAGAGCPLVLSDIDTFRELWTGAALFVPEQTAEAYAAAIDRLLGDPSLRLHLGEAARMRAARYLPAAMASSMASIYAGLRVPAERRAA